METYDPKPDATSEFRGLFGPIGSRVSELLPLHAKNGDKLTVLRSMSHTGGGYPAGSLQMLSGDPDLQNKPPGLPRLDDGRELPARRLLAR